MFSFSNTYNHYQVSNLIKGHRGRDRIIVGFTTTYAISAYHHQSCELEFRSGVMYSIQHYVIKFVSVLRQVDGSFRALRFPPSITMTSTI